MSIRNTKYVKIESQDTPIVKFIDTEDRKYGISLNDILGDVGLDGVYRCALRNKPFVVNFDGIVEFDPYYSWGKFAYMFEWNESIKGVDFASVKKLNANRLFVESFYNCPNLEFALFPNVEVVGEISSGGYALDSAFRLCPLLTEFDMPKLMYVYGEYAMSSILYGCSNVRRINLPSLKRIDYSYGMQYFAAQTAIEEMKFQSLSYIGNYGLNYAFYRCSNLEDVWFYALESAYNQYAFNSMLSGCSDVTVHLPMRMESTMSGWSVVAGGFGGTNTTVLFDIVTSIVGGNGNTYSRQEKSSVDRVIAWTLDGDLYYTNDVNVGDAIYSDPTCVNVVTVITSRS